jgi:hypothetical protein
VSQGLHTLYSPSADPLIANLILLFLKSCKPVDPLYKPDFPSPQDVLEWLQPDWQLDLDPVNGAYVKHGEVVTTDEGALRMKEQEHEVGACM